MPQFTINIEDQRGDAVSRYAALADMTPEDLISGWIKDKVDNVTVQAMRAAEKSWETVAETLECSTTQARRIYAKGIDMPLISKAEVRILERYVDLIERSEDIKLWTPSEDDILTIERLTSALTDAAEASEDIRIPTETDIDATSRLARELPKD